jgi:hypothetical protein
VQLKTQKTLPRQIWVNQQQKSKRFGDSAMPNYFGPLYDAVYEINTKA